MVFRHVSRIRAAGAHNNHQFSPLVYIRTNDDIVPLLEYPHARFAWRGSRQCIQNTLASIFRAGRDPNPWIAWHQQRWLTLQKISLHGHISSTMNVFGAHLLCDVGGGGGRRCSFFSNPTFSSCLFFFHSFFSSGQTAEKTSGFLFCKIFFSRDMCTCSNNKPKKLSTCLHSQPIVYRLAFDTI